MFEDIIETDNDDEELYESEDDLTEEEDVENQDDDEENVSLEDEEENDRETNEKNNETRSCDDLEASDSTDHSESEEDDDSNSEDTNDIISTFPPWFINKLYPANLPRFFVDLMHLRKYINNPQIEHFPYNECNAIALPILKLTYALLNNVKGQEYVPKVMEDGSVRNLFFTYLTRATRVTNIRYDHIEIEKKPKYDFEPDNPNPIFLKEVFDNKKSELQPDEMFADLEKLPHDIRLYFMAVAYWLQKSQHCDLIHLHALIICLVVLRTIDSKIPAERDMKAFQKRFGKIIKKERLVRDKELANGAKRMMNDDVRALPIPERMSYIPKSDCYLVQNDLLKHFHMQDIFKKKYDLYSSIVLHAFAEFQSVVFQLHSLNALLNFPYAPVHMAQSYCGVFLYNLYDLLKNRLDVEYFVRNFIFKDSQMMFDFYLYLWHWCEKYIPSWKQVKDQSLNPVINKKLLKKKRQLARKNAAMNSTTIEDPNADMLSGDDQGDDGYVDLNNKFCTVLKIN